MEQGPITDATFSEVATRVELDRGEILVSEGDEADAVFYVLDGRLDAVHGTGVGDVIVGSIGPGEIVGETTAMTGGRRRATLRAPEGATVLSVPTADFVALLDDQPELAATLAATTRDRVDRTEVVAMVTELAGSSDAALVQEIIDRVSWRRLGVGEVLFEEGDESDAAYFIVSGRLQATTDATGEHTVLGEFGRGEVVGELGLLDDAPRSASIRARRDTTLAVFPRDAFEDLVTRWPGLMLHVARGILTRLRRLPRRRIARAVSVTIVATAAVDAEPIVAGVAAELARFGVTERLSADAVDARLRQPGIADCGPDEPGVPRLSEVLHDIDVRADHIVIEADRARPNWTRRALHQGDRTVIVASANPSDAERTEIRSILDMLEGTESHRMLALLHPTGAERPRGTTALLASLGISEVTHLRSGNAADVARLARLASGNGVGLVLGGGGARGFAHLGVHRQFRERGVPIDFYGGCSMGSVLGAAMAMDLEPDDIEARAADMFGHLRDYTIPVVSFLKGARVTERIRSQFGTWDIEDLWLPFYCVSTNLTQSRLEIHRRGDLAHAIRSSTAIPGVLPPVPYGADLLVDGGVLDNLPVETMRDDGRVDTVIAVDVALRLGPSAPSDYGESVSGVRALAARVGRRQSPYPSMPAVLVRSMLTGALSNLRHALTAADLDLLIELHLPDVGLLEFDRVADVARRGYASVDGQIADWARSEPWRHRPTTEYVR